MVRWEENTPEGAQLQVRSFEDGALYVTDVWNSQADFERFFNDRLAAAVQEAGIEGEPQTRFRPLHRRFIAPASPAPPVNGCPAEAWGPAPSRCRGWKSHERRHRSAARPRRLGARAAAGRRSWGKAS